jgi:hypothetical protein
MAGEEALRGLPGLAGCKGEGTCPQLTFPVYFFNPLAQF